MARKTWWMGMLLVTLSSTGCCRWCERWCGPSHYGQPAACAPQCCVPCCPTSQAPPPPPQFQRAPYCP